MDEEKEEEWMRKRRMNGCGEGRGLDEEKEEDWMRKRWRNG